MNILVASVTLGRELIPVDIRRRRFKTASCWGESTIAWLTCVFLLLALLDSFNAQTEQNNCTSGFYFNTTSGRCVTCTNCSALGRVEVEPCSDTTDSGCADPQTRNDCEDGEFYDETIRRCKTCRQCRSNEETLNECSVDKDTQCQVKCGPDFVYHSAFQSCSLNCTKCPDGCIDAYHCACEPKSCYVDSDYLCQNILPECEPNTETTTVSTTSSSSKNSLEPWGIGLVAVGIVIGIVAFSACFLMMGMCTSSSSQTRRQRPDIGSEESQTSHSGLVFSGSSLTGTTTTSLGAASDGSSVQTATPVITCSRKSLEMIRQQNQKQQQELFRHQFFNSSVIKSSPRSLRTGGSGRKESNIDV